MLVYSTRWVLGVRPCGQQIRLLSISHARHNAHALQVGPEVYALPKTRSFAKLGIRDTILSGMNGAFPHIQAPTRVQERFITAISEGKDLMLKDATGTGKSFGIALALLNKARISKPDRKRVDDGAVLPINSIYIVPHKDLAYQVQHWIQRISADMPGKPGSSMSSVVDVLVRGTGLSAKEQATRLKTNPPHILVGTPQAIWEVLSHDPEALQPQYINTVAVDEVDYLIPSIPRGMTKYKQAKMEQKMARHPSITAQIIDHILRTRPAKQDRADLGEVWRDLSVKERQQTRPPLQLIFSSATLRTHLDIELKKREGWITRGVALAQITGKPHRGTGLSHAPGSTVPDKDRVHHSILTVSGDGSVRNVEGAQAAVVSSPPNVSAAMLSDSQEMNATPDDLAIVDDMEYEGAPLSVGGSTKLLAVNPVTLETVAACFALDVPRVALLVVPATAPVHAFVAELQSLGVNAHGLDLLSGDQGRGHLLQAVADAPETDPVLLVATEASIRGIDLPDLSHVFLLGKPQGRMADSYLHIAGRVGRFGRSGHVITVSEEADARRMRILLKEIGITPTKFEHFD